MLSTLPKVNFKDQELEQFQRNAIDRLNQLSGIAFLDGVEIKGVSLTTGSANQIQHKLGRPYQGYFITRLTAQAIVYEDQGSFNRSLVLPLSCSANCVVDLWVY